MQALKLKIPPPIVALVMAGLMWLIARFVPTLTFVIPRRGILAGCVALAGVAISVMGAASFRRAGTTVNPMMPEKASALVTSGIFKLSRNPMYLGLLIVLVAWAVFLSNAFAFLLVPLFVLYMNYFQIRPEEIALSSAFGQEFESYRSRVRKWL